MNERGCDLDIPVAGAGTDQLPKGVIVGRAAVRVAGTVLLNRADKDRPGIDGLSPADRRAQKVSVAKRYIRDWDFRADRLRRVRHRDGRVRKRGAADHAEQVKPEMQKALDPDCLCHGASALKLTRFRSLPIGDVQCAGLVVPSRQRGAHAGIHAA